MITYEPEATRWTAPAEERLDGRRQRRCAVCQGRIWEGVYLARSGAEPTWRILLCDACLSAALARVAAKGAVPCRHPGKTTSTGSRRAGRTA